MPRFKDTAPNKVSVAARKARKKTLARILQLETNINAFIAAVEEVTFNVDEENAKPWMASWQANLLSGKID